MEGKKLYFFKRNGEIIGRGFEVQEAAVKVAKQYQEYDHKIEGDFTSVKGVRKPVVYKVEEYQFSHSVESTSGYQRTYNDIILPDLNEAVPARLDADKTAKPLTKIGIKMDPGRRFYGVKEFHDPQLINNQTGEKIPLFRN